MLFSQAGLLFTLAGSVAAVPFEKRWFGGGWGSWSNHGSSEGIDSLFGFGKRHSLGKLLNTQCDVSRASLPQVTDTNGVALPAESQLPAVSEGLSLYHVAVGRGTQNYTCDAYNANAAPVAAGAVASLFNFTCVADTSPSLLNVIPPIAIDMPCPSSDDSNSPVNQLLSGHHYFTDATTAYFNLDTDLNNYGAGGFKKVNNVSAPANAIKGQWGQGYGAVQWLKLQTKSEDQCVFQEIYRVNTAGGNPPKDCSGSAAEFQVQYSAEYWFYASS